MTVLMLGSACDDSTSPDTVISIRITQPTDSQVVRDSVLRILTEVSTNCGCQAYVEFHLDGVHQYSDYLPFFSYDWDVSELSGLHVIKTRVVVPDRGEAWDSVRVFLNPADSLRGSTKAEGIL
jgi:hypothetical protein